jgi:hypothetical protein
MFLDLACGLCGKESDKCGKKLQGTGSNCTVGWRESNALKKKALL